MRKLVAPVVAALIACAFVAPVASADDASLRAAVQSQERKAKPVAEAFLKAAQGLNRSDRSITRLSEATTAMIRVFGRYVSAVSAEDASSAKGERAKRALLNGLRGMNGGLRTFRTALAKLQEGASREEVMRPMRSALDRITKAQRTIKGAQALMPKGTAA